MNQLNGEVERTDHTPIIRDARRDDAKEHPDLSGCQ